ncbi:hypothetical protein AVEN_230618-1 [Araneus ventricosus]|uniref:Uncharacterized protein n=1 Tax=Araneus ventricosus TaxID=182803 RepID=A0A4Y2A238_ARAVE|nr:hypothetical protein AVEN_230618-1 [Araneus ventricosus]
MVIFSAISTDSSFIIQISTHAGKRETLSTCNFLSSFPFTKPSAENTLLWWKNLFLNKLSRIKIAKLMSFLTENEDLIEHQPVHPTPIHISLLHQDLILMDPDTLEVQYQGP